MASEPTELLAIAWGLMEEATEAHFRSAANRAYYAAFHFGRALALSLPAPKKPKPVLKKGKKKNRKVLTSS